MLNWRFSSTPPSQPDFSGTWGSCFGGLCYKTGYQWTAQDEAILLGKLASKIRGHNFNLAVSIAEARESLGMIGSSAIRLATAFHALRRRDFRTMFNTINLSPRQQRLVRSASKYDVRLHDNYNPRDKIGNAWLEAQYGWVPLLSDAKSAAEALAYSQVQHTLSFRVRRSKDNIKLFYPCSNPNSASVLGNHKTAVQLKVTLKDDFDPLVGLGLTDPLTVAWEIVPYSFVVDWFIPIGNYLETRSVLRAAKVQRVIRSELMKGDLSLVPGYTNPGNSYRIKGGSYHVIGVSLRRSISSSLPNIEFPGFNSLLEVPNWKHALSGIALLQQRFK